MLALVLGLLIFLGVHSVRVFADDWRTGAIRRMGALPWKAIYSVLSIAGFVLIVWGYGMARRQPVVLWLPPVGLRHLTALLMVPVFMLFVAAYVPRNGFKARLHHPQILSVKLWAFAHLLSNGMLADVVLFGSFLAWAIVDFRAARRRDLLAQQAQEDPWNVKTGFYRPDGADESKVAESAAPGPAPAAAKGTAKGTIVCVVLGLVVYAAFLMGLHRIIVGVAIV